MTGERPRPAEAPRTGRRPDNDIAPASDPAAAKHHAELRVDPEGRFQIIDLGSHHGTYVNGVRVTRETLTEGDIVSIGHATFRLSGGELREHEGESPGSGEAGGPA
jgi:ABC transport system ATP-binding/permease protein